MKKTQAETSNEGESKDHNGTSNHRRWIKQQKRILLLLFLLGLYSVIGALVFRHLEHGVDDMLLARIHRNKHLALTELKLGLKSGVDAHNWTRMAERLMDYYVEDVLNAVEHGIDLQSINNEEPSSQWDFWGGLLYAGSLYTTIGNSRVTPVYKYTKLLAIIYSVIGVPLCLLALAETGRLISRVIRHSVKRLKPHLHPHVKSRQTLKECWPKQVEIDTLAGSSALCIYGSLCIAYLLVGALAMNFSHSDPDSSHFDDIYYLFGAASTIGFGHSIGGHPALVVIACLYTFLGLSLVSTGFAILQERLESAAKRGVMGKTAGQHHQSHEGRAKSDDIAAKVGSFDRKVQPMQDIIDSNCTSAEQVNTLGKQDPPIIEETITASQAGTVTAGVTSVIKPTIKSTIKPDATANVMPEVTTDWTIVAPSHTPHIDIVPFNTNEQLENTDITVEATIILD